MRIDSDKHYLVLTNRAGDQLRALLAQPTAVVSDLRRLMLGVLREGEVVGEYQDRRGRGLANVVRGWCRAGGGVMLEVVVIYAVWHDHPPVMSKDGLRRMVYLDEVRLVPDEVEVRSAESQT